MDWVSMLPPAPSRQRRRRPRWWRAFVDWLYRPAGLTDDPQALVELTCLPNRIQAEALVRELGMRDVKAVLFGADADGWAPHFSIGEGYRVMVRARDVGRATRALTRH